MAQCIESQSLATSPPPGVCVKPLLEIGQATLASYSYLTANAIQSRALKPVLGVCNGHSVYLIPVEELSSRFDREHRALEQPHLSMFVQIFPRASCHSKGQRISCFALSLSQPLAVVATEDHVLHLISFDDRRVCSEITLNEVIREVSFMFSHLILARTSKNLVKITFEARQITTAAVLLPETVSSFAAHESRSEVVVSSKGSVSVISSDSIKRHILFGSTAPKLIHVGSDWRLIGIRKPNIVARDIVRSLSDQNEIELSPLQHLKDISSATATQPNFVQVFAADLDGCNTMERFHKDLNMLNVADMSAFQEASGLLAVASLYCSHVVVVRISNSRIDLVADVQLEGVGDQRVRGLCWLSPGDLMVLQCCKDPECNDSSVFGNKWLNWEAKLIGLRFSSRQDNGDSSRPSSKDLKDHINTRMDNLERMMRHFFDQTNTRISDLEARLNCSTSTSVGGQANAESQKRDAFETD